MRDVVMGLLRCVVRCAVRLESEPRPAVARAWGRVWSRTGALLAVALWALAACSPAFNWRDVRPEGGSVGATLPCKPESAQRTVELAGQPVALRMLSCDVGGLTFAMSQLRVPPSLPLSTVVDAWQQASLASLKVAAGQSQVWEPEVRLPPDSGVQLRGWKAVGMRPDGSAVPAHGVMLARDGEVTQLVVYGPVTAAVLAQWLEGISLGVRPRS